ncbi:MAG: ferrous iron transport protein B [Bacteroidales bacterium]
MQVDVDIQTRLLSELGNGDVAIITKVKGHGAFRKRIVEMGFVAGTKVKVIKRAPLQDPVEYELMGYRVSLRLSEAELIETIGDLNSYAAENKFNGTLTDDSFNASVREKTNTINVALVGNPNCGKTTLFNYATGMHERVGNYGGVTVDVKTAHFVKDGFTLNITDLPGTYSISTYSPEELFVRKHILEEMPDVVINVVDAANLERNLFLTTQLIDMNVKVVIALNMYDELEKRGDSFDYEKLGKMLGIPIIPTVASKGKGLNNLIKKVIQIYDDADKTTRHIHVNYGEIINKSIQRIKVEAKKNDQLAIRFHSQYVAIKLLEKDKSFVDEISILPNTSGIIAIANAEAMHLESEFNETSETIIADAKFGFIKGALKETYRCAPDSLNAKKRDVDTILTHKWLGFPIFLFFMWAMFQLTFSLGGYPMDWIDAGVGMLGEFLENIMPEGALRDLLVNGIIGGVGGVIIFLPNIVILFFCISLMEDTGYMARAAFIMDKLMHKIGLHGKSFIPLLMGFGCNVPAIMATRTLESRKDRLLTILIIPFMSCSARLPVYVLLISAFFPAKQGLVLLSIYAIGILSSVVIALIFKKIFFSKAEAPFVMELPPYRIPTVRSTVIHMWDKSVQYLTKMGTVILAASIIIWALGYFPREVTYSTNYDNAIALVDSDASLTDDAKQEQINLLEVEKESERMEKSYIGQMGHFVEPVIAPLGFDWKIGVSIITGLAAKEIVVGSMGVLYQSDLSADENSVGLQTKLQQQEFKSGPKKGEKVFTPLVAFTLMIFVLLYFPCVAVIAAIRREVNAKWAFFTMFYTTLFAWLVAFAAYQIGSLFI